MMHSFDDLIRVDCVKNTFNITPVAADFSIVDIPVDGDEAKCKLENIFNSPTTRHVSLLVSRHKRKNRASSISNLIIAQKVGFEYLDTVSIVYERPSTCSNNGFLPICEIGHLVHKGPVPDVKTTKWLYDEEYSNATNLWTVQAHPEEKRSVTYHQKFTWDVPLLLRSLSLPLENNRFVYNAEITAQEMESLFVFCRVHKIGVQLYTTSESMANHIIKTYNSDYANQKK